MSPTPSSVTPHNYTMKSFHRRNTGHSSRYQMPRKGGQASVGVFCQASTPYAYLKTQLNQSEIHVQRDFSKQHPTTQPNNVPIFVERSAHHSMQYNALRIIYP